jgi:hypothetical protein
VSRKRRHNASVLAHRSSPHLEAHEQSVRSSWDYRRREPANLREAVHQVRKAYADEVPESLHYGPDVVGDGGTPRFTDRAENYLFGKADPNPRLDPETHLPDAVDWYPSPFRAALDRMEHAIDSASRRRAAIVRHVTIGQMSPVEAAIAEKAHPDDARLVAENALRCFLRDMTDMRVHPAVRDPDLAPQETTAA